MEAAGADFASFSERFEGVLKRLASTISGISSWKGAPVSPSDEPRALLNATEKNRVLQDIVPISRASSPSLPERPPSPTAAMTANDRMNQLLEGLKEDPLRQAELQAAIRTGLKAISRNSTLQSSIKDASFAAASDSSINTVPAPTKSIVDSATPVTPMTPAASLPPTSGQLAGSPPVATPPLTPEVGPETKAPITTSQTADRDVVDDDEADAIAAEVDEVGPNSDDDASVKSKDTDNNSGYESDPEGGSEGGEKQDNSLGKL